jgi:hypothetical protein
MNYKIKICSKCKIEKDLSEFNKCKNKKDGVSVWCKECFKQYRKEHKKHASDYKKQYCQKNKEKISQYYQNNKFTILKTHKIYKDKNKAKICFIERNKMAIRRKKEFNLTFEWFMKNIWDYNCFYCNNTCNGGIDRLLSEVGYIEDNCVPCCKKCNNIKHLQIVQEMYERIGHIINYTNYNKNDINYNLSPSKLFANKKHNAKKEKKELMFDKEYYLNYIYKKQCAFCGCITAGIDRIDSLKGYEIGNIQPCCWACNTGKNDMTVEEFYFHLQKMWNRKDEVLKILVNYENKILPTL